MKSLIDGTLDLLRFELGLIPVRWRRVVWDSWVAELLRDHATVAKAKGLKWNQRIQSIDAKTLLIDEPNLRRLVNNLVGNAVKFTQEGAVTVEVSLEKLGEPLAWADWTVTDSGPGLPHELWAQSKGFHRVPLSNADGPAGSGLGLVLSRRLVDLAGGELSYEPRRPRGSAFSFRYPMVGLDPPVSGGKDTEAEPPFAGRVLVVENQSGQQEYLAGGRGGLGRPNRGPCVCV